MAFWKKESKVSVNTAPVMDDGNVGTAADVEAVMKKYDRESNTRIWTGVPKQVVRFVMAAFSVYCIAMTLLFRGIAEIPLTLFLGFIIIIGYLNFPMRKHNVRSISKSLVKTFVHARTHEPVMNLKIFKIHFNIVVGSHIHRIEYSKAMCTSEDKSSVRKTT